jgi:hypothetical protein
MINNNKADTIFLFGKKPYPLQPVLSSVPRVRGTSSFDGGELRDDLIVSVEPGTIVDPLKQKEHSVIKQRTFFELKDGEALYLVANIVFPPKIKSGKIELFDTEFDDEGQPIIVKKFLARYKAYVKRYKIDDFQIKVDDYDDPSTPAPKHSLMLAHREGDKLIQDVFPERSSRDIDSNFNQLYFSANIPDNDLTVGPGSFDGGLYAVAFLKGSPIDLTKPDEDFGSVRYFFSHFEAN